MAYSFDNQFHTIDETTARLLFGIKTSDLKRVIRGERRHVAGFIPQRINRVHSKRFSYVFRRNGRVVATAKTLGWLRSGITIDRAGRIYNGRGWTGVTVTHKQANNY